RMTSAEQDDHEQADARSGPLSVKDYGSAAAYAEEVRKWVVASQCWAICHQMACMHSYAYVASCLNPQLSASQRATSAASRSDGAPQAQATGQSRQRRTIPSFSRRIAAEIIDSVIAFGVKLFIVYFLVEINAIDLEKYDRLLSDEADLQSLIDITQELFPIELLGKVVISVAEALFLSYGWGSVPSGATPGKGLMGIQVLSCRHITPIPGTDDVEVLRDPHVPFKNSLLRSLIKNMLINLLFPLSAAAYAFNYNRAIYDLAANTIVVYIQ
uniref:RDD domain-containing protein n=1 Tax=Parascaris univalens TaxID=6257 RepID=A0A915AJA0_PARUN